MPEYKLPVNGALWSLVMEKDGALRACYYISGELSLGDTSLRNPQKKIQVKIQISGNMYKALETELEVNGKDSRVFISGGLELFVKVPCIN